jgi:hypothetical protein
MIVGRTLWYLEAFRWAGSCSRQTARPGILEGTLAWVGWMCLSTTNVARTVDRRKLILFLLTILRSSSMTLVSLALWSVNYYPSMSCHNEMEVDMN